LSQFPTPPRDLHAFPTRRSSDLVRFRTTGYRLMIELHLLFPSDCPVGEAHRLATLLEERLPETLGTPAEVVTHLEALEDHADVHREEHYTGVPGTGG